MTRAEALALGRRVGAPLGGQAVKGRQAPASCPHCGKSMAGRGWLSYLGHLGLHGLADRYFAGDVGAAQRRLSENGMARQDPFPQNGYFPRYTPITQESECSKSMLYGGTDGFVAEAGGQVGAD